ncbi:helix-turn-helix domain-containing protein [Rhodopila sp.]|uniref:helix-turn-helix domain-containing protein n=1 Tax=Rhodopila sp. TaxID=2480087 RepID=UPI003D152E69
MPLNTPLPTAFVQTAFSVRQVAARWGVSGRHVYDLVASEAIGHLRIGGLIRIRIADIEEYEERQCHAPSSTSQDTGSPNVGVDSMSAGGKMGRGNAFRLGRKTAARQNGP